MKQNRLAGQTEKADLREKQKIILIWIFSIASLACLIILLIGTLVGASTSMGLKYLIIGNMGLVVRWQWYLTREGKGIP